MSRKMISENGEVEVLVVEHIILKNFWEYYVLDDKYNSNDKKFCYVIGFEEELGDVSMEEIRPHIMSKTTNLNDIMPPKGWKWVQ